MNYKEQMMMEEAIASADLASPSTLQQLQRLAQWVIDNRYDKSEQEKVSDSEMYQYVTEQLERAYQLGMKEQFERSKEHVKKLLLAMEDSQNIKNKL